MGSSSGGMGRMGGYGRPQNPWGQGGGMFPPMQRNASGGFGSNSGMNFQRGTAQNPNGGYMPAGGDFSGIQGALGRGMGQAGNFERPPVTVDMFNPETGGMGSPNYQRKPMNSDLFDPNTGGMKQPGFGTKPAVNYQSGTQQNPGGGYMPAGGNYERPPMTVDQFNPMTGGMQRTGGQMNQPAQTGAGPGGWQPSFGGSAPNPFLPQQRTGGEMVQPPPSFQPAPNNMAPQAPQWDPAYTQDRAQQYGQNLPKAATTSANGNPPPMPPQPTGPMQPGQLGWKYGPDLMGNRDSPFGWQPQFGEGYNDYIVQMLNGGQAPWGNQIDRNNVIASIGQLSGRQFNPATQSSFNTLLWGR